MINLDSIPSELAFLHAINGNRFEQFRSADWLVSNFEDSIWECKFGEVRSFSIDFEILIDNGSKLTDPRNQTLLDTFKCFLCLQTHFDKTGGKTISSSSAYNAVRRALHLLDYFLLNAHYFSLSKHGFALVTKNNLFEMLSIISKNRSVIHTLYDFNNRMKNFICTLSGETDNKIIEDALSNTPDLSLIRSVDRHLYFDNSDLAIARATLWVNNYYCRTTTGGYRFRVHRSKLLRELFANTLSALNTNAPLPEELNIGEKDRLCYREYPAVPVRNNSETPSKRLLEKYRNTLSSIGLLNSIQLNTIPIEILSQLNNKSVLNTFNLKPEGRFRSLPQNLVFTSLKNSIEFSIKYGVDLIDSYLAIARAAIESKLSITSYSYGNDIRQHISARLVDLGVCYWSLERQISICEKGALSEKLGDEYRSEFFGRFRSNEGLFELISVFYGCVQILLGTLMARRQAELNELKPFGCLNKAETHLVFLAGKSGQGDIRERMQRPIPEIAVRFIKEIQRLHRGLADLGINIENKKLFSRPLLQQVNLEVSSSPTYYSNIDMFCDYFQTNVNHDGERNYIRQHQIRRFFAMLFFWSNTFGNMDTLRWFMGHTDIQHLYNYITESVTGAVLNATKSTYATEQILSNSRDADNLRDLVFDHFGTKDISVMSSDDVEVYIEYLIERGVVEIEPVFFDAPDGQRYRIIIKINRGLSDENV